MDALQKSLDKVIDELPRLFLEKMLSKKLESAEVKPTKTLLRRLAEHVLSGNCEPFICKGRKPNAKNITLTLEQADLNEMTIVLNVFCESQLPKLLRDVAVSAAKPLLKNLKSRWGDEHILQQADFTGFRKRLEDRWGKPLGQLRMLLTISREWCQETLNHESQREKDNKLDLRNVLIRLLVRACQVTDEIICLLENGFADGAMARWRTLHEIGIVAAILSLHGEDIVERYVAHQAVESKRAMDKYVQCCEQIGYKPISDRARKKITKAYEAALARYGKNFKGDYGWASEHLKKERPTFSHLEAEAGRAEMRAHYQMANDNVHAGVKSMFVRLGLLEDYTGLLAGRSNAGLMEPGQNTAHALTQISVLVCLSAERFDDLLAAEAIKTLRDEIPQSFYHAHKKLRGDDERYRKPPRKNGLPHQLGREGAP